MDRRAAIGTGLAPGCGNRINLAPRPRPATSAQLPMVVDLWRASQWRAGQEGRPSSGNHWRMVEVVLDGLVRGHSQEPGVQVFMLSRFGRAECRHRRRLHFYYDWWLPADRAGSNVGVQLGCPPVAPRNTGGPGGSNKQADNERVGESGIVRPTFCDNRCRPIHWYRSQVRAPKIPLLARDADWFAADEF